MKRRIWLQLVLAMTAIALSAPAMARPKAKTDHELRLGQLISSVRYGQDLSALTYMDGEAQAKVLLGAAWETGTPEQRTEFVRLFHHIFAGIAFPKMRENFQHLTTITYSPLEQKGELAEVGSVIHIQAGPKEQELKVHYVLSKSAAAELRVVDVTVQGDKPMLTNIRDDQVQPILKEGGWAMLLKEMKARAADFPVPADKAGTAPPN